MDLNPYSSSALTGLTHGGEELPDRSPGILGTTLRRIALVVFLLPVMLALPVHYWSFNVAGHWYVNTDIDPEERRVCLAVMYILDMTAICAAVPLPGLTLLFIDNYRRRLVGFLMLMAVVPFMFAILVLVTMVEAFHRFS